MKEFISRQGSAERISGRNVRLLCTSRAPGRVHAGLYVASRDIWRINSALYPAGPHTCKTEVRGCVAATQLRALHAALRIAGRDTTFSVEMTDFAAVQLVKQWQTGVLTSPPWFRQQGKNGRWLYALSLKIARNPGILTVKVVELQKVRWGKQTKTAVDSLIALSTMRHPERRDEAVTREILPLFTELPV